MSDYKEIDSLPMRFMSLLYSNKGENVTKNATTAVLISTRCTYASMLLYCCSAHDSFKTCVIEETKECPCQDEQGSCGDQTQTASHFAKVIVDNSLGFLLKQCNSIM